MQGTDWTLAGTSSFGLVALMSGTLTNDGVLTATEGVTFAAADGQGRLLGGSLRTGVTLEPSEGWSLTPSARLSYLHQWVAGYDEDLSYKGEASQDGFAHALTGEVRIIW